MPDNVISPEIYRKKIIELEHRTNIKMQSERFKTETNNTDQFFVNYETLANKIHSDRNRMLDVYCKIMNPNPDDSSICPSSRVKPLVDSEIMNKSQ